MDIYSKSEGFRGQRMIVLPNAIRTRLCSNPLTRHFHITDIGYFPRAGGHFRRRRQGAAEHIFIYCVDGGGWIEIQDSLIELKPNQYIILPKHMEHAYGAGDEDPWSIYWLHYEGDIADELYRRHKEKGNWASPVPFSADRISTFNTIFGILGSYNIESGLEYANIMGFQFISSFVLNDPDQSLKSGRSKDLGQAILDYLQEHLDKPVRIKEIADHFKYSPVHIYTHFKQKTGYSLVQFSNLKKIQKACELLSYSNHRIKEISYMTGFEDQLYFSRLFKKYMGISPSTYRNKHHGG